MTTISRELTHMNQFIVHIPSDYSKTLRGRIERDFKDLPASIETRWQVRDEMLGVDLIVKCSPSARTSCTTILEKLLGRALSTDEMAHQDPTMRNDSPLTVKHFQKDIGIAPLGETSSKTN